MTAARIMQAVGATWPAAEVREVNGFALRDGQGGGQRVSAATALGVPTARQVEAAEKAMHTPLFMVRPGEETLDGLLDARGYAYRDETVIYTTPIDTLTDLPIPPVTAFTIWEPLAIMNDIWATDGIGESRLAVMARAQIKTAVFARWDEKPAGAAFVAVDGEVCMVHGLVVLPFQRRKGVAEWMMRRAALWGQEQGAAHMAVLCVADNAPANALYRALGFTEVGRYHYRTPQGDRDAR